MSTVRLYKRGKHWYVDYAVNGKRIRKSVSTNKQRASHLVMKGTPLYDVGKLLGHTSTDMTRKYAHLAPGHLKKTVDRL